MNLKAITPIEILLKEFMQPLNMDIFELKKMCSSKNEYITNVFFNGEDITENFASDLNTIFGTKKDFWLQLQDKYKQRTSTISA